MTKKLTAIILAAGLASGCATTTNNYQYKETIAAPTTWPRPEASTTPGITTSPGTNETVLSARDGMSRVTHYFSIPDMGLIDWGKSLGLGLLTSAFAPKGVMERDSVFGWVPETKAGDAGEAWELMSNTLLDGIEKSLQQANVDYIVDNRNLHQDLPLVSGTFSPRCGSLLPSTVALTGKLPTETMTNPVTWQRPCMPHGRATKSA